MQSSKLYFVVVDNICISNKKVPYIEKREL